MLIFSGYMAFTFESLSEMSARQNGHITLAHKKYFEDDEPVPMAYGMAKWKTVQEQMEQLPETRYVLPRIHFSGLISNGEKSMIFIGKGVDVEYEFVIQGPFLDIKQGDMLASESEIPEVMLGVDLARSLKVKLGDVLTLLGTTSSGALNGLDVMVVGTYATGSPDMDKRALTVSLQTAQELLNTSSVSTLSLYLDSTEKGDAMLTGLRSAYPDLSLKTWEDLAPFFHKVRDLYQLIFGMLGIIILIVVLLSVANTMSMAVLERTREIGIMAAMGAFPRQILFNFISESMIIGLLGALLGAACAMLVTVILPFAHVMMPPPPGSNVGYPLLLNFSVATYAVISVLMVFITTLGGWFAARKSVKKPIVEALSHV